MKELIGLFLCVISACAVASSDFGTARLQVSNLSPLTVELAATDQQRARGLMHRTELCADCGMLFDFGETRYVGIVNLQ